MKSKLFQIMVIVALLSIAISPVSAGSIPNNSQPQSTGGSDGAILTTSDVPGPVQAVKTSQRLIVELSKPPLADYLAQSKSQVQSGVRPDLNTPQAQAYISQLQADQAAFVGQMQAVLPGASVAAYLNGAGARVALTYQVVFNGLTVENIPGNLQEARKVLSAIPGVKAVSLDYAHDPDMYASLPLINAGAAWNNPAIGGESNAGKGVKVASMDGGIHHLAPMFNGTGYSYPPGYPSSGLGLTANNNGKIIASRVYFRTWDPPSPGDENPWPGTKGTPHGTHTASTAAGDEVLADYQGITVTLSGVAPMAWVMSYRVFYNSITNDGSFYEAEGLAALEDIAKDGADVLNNSWGGGPGSMGGQFDPLDTALLNVAKTGTFVSMSAGNAGPGNGTTDHSSDGYIVVGASTTTGTFANGKLNVSAPLPITTTLQSIPFGIAEFGAPLVPGQVYGFPYLPSAAVDPANTIGCNPWPAGTFTGKAALIMRGTCNFSVKVYYAQQAGADFVVIYNQPSSGDTLITMAPGTFADQVTISSVIVGNSFGQRMVNWYNVKGSASAITLDNRAFQIGNTPDIMASFSSRGPGVGNVLKPDITAPGVNILAQGFAVGTGEERSLGFGQASGTSMASPHVAGAAALLRQIHPNWTNADIKSALMSTSKYLGIYNEDGTPAQPLDMGAGRLDLTHTADPGLVFSPPSISFGLVPTGTTPSLDIFATNVTAAAETYHLDGLMVAGSGMTFVTSVLPGFTITPTTLTINPGVTAKFSVKFNPANGKGTGDNQGFIELKGSSHNAHLPVWARVVPASTADVLLIDNDASSSLGAPDYSSYYTSALTNLGLTFDIIDVDNLAGPNGVLTFLPDAASLDAYKAVIYFTGDNYQPNGTFTVPTPLTSQDMDRLAEYANSGGTVIAMGQDLASVLNSTSSANAHFFYSNVLGGAWLQDSVTNNSLPTLPVIPMPGAPANFQSVNLNLNGPSFTTVPLLGANVVPPVDTITTGEGSFSLNNVTNQLTYQITVNTTSPISITATGIHTGTVGMNGVELFSLLPAPMLVTDTLTLNGHVTLSAAQRTVLLGGGLYVDISTEDNPAGELRAQIVASISGDGAANQYFVDEIKTTPFKDPGYEFLYPYTALLKYAGANNVADGTTGMAHRDEPTLERPGINYLGKSIYTTFGLEGVNNGLNGFTSREELLSLFLNWAMDEPSVSIQDVTPVNASNLTMVKATLESNINGDPGVKYRWDFGDGTPFTGFDTSTTFGHTYQFCGEYQLRVEAVDALGNHTIGTKTLSIMVNCTVHRQFLSVIRK